MFIKNTSDQTVRFPWKGGEDIIINPEESVEVSEEVGPLLLRRYGFLIEKEGVDSIKPIRIATNIEKVEISEEDELRNEYKRLSGVSAPKKWKFETIQTKVEEMQDEEKERMDEAKNINSKKEESEVDESGINFIDGKPKMLVDGKYIDHEEAQIKIKERKLKKEELEIEELKSNLKK